LSALSLVDISSNRVSSGAEGSEGEAQSGDKKACDKAAHKNKEAVSFEPKEELVFMVHARSLGLRLQGRLAGRHTNRSA
jgi:hypothetical protein